MASKKIKVIEESPTGLNTKFKTPDGREVTREKLCSEIRKGQHLGYHVRNINGKNIPCSNPDGIKKNNLG